MDTEAKSNLDGENGEVQMSSKYIVMTSREQDMQKLLAEERQRSEQRKNNYQALKMEHIKLQQDFLALQTETKSILEETKILKEKKENEINEMKNVLEENNKTIENLKKNLIEKDSENLKKKLSEQMREPIDRLKKENSLLTREREKLSYDVKMAQQKIAFLEKELIDEVERIRLKYEAEANLIQKEKDDLKAKFMEECKTPEGQRILNLTQENNKLKTRLKALQEVIEESQAECKKIQNKIEIILTEQEKNETDHKKQVESLKLTLNSFKEENLKLEEMVKIAEHEKEILVKEIKKIEKDLSKSDEKFLNLEKKLDQEKNLTKKLFAKEKKDLESENMLLLDQVKKLKEEIFSINESLEKLEKSKEKREKEFKLEFDHMRQIELNEKHSLEREKVLLELKLKDLGEEKLKIKDELEQSKRQIENGMELKMNLEKEMLLLQTKVESLQLCQEEIEKYKKSQIDLQEKINKLSNDLGEINAANKDLKFQKERYKEEFNRTKCELETERKELMEFKASSERNLIRLKACIEDERNEMKNKVVKLQDEIKKKYNEREEMKLKCKQFVNLIQKLQSKTKNLQAKFDEKEKQEDGKVSMKAHKQLKKEYKKLKKRQKELTSTLVNMSKDANELK